MAAWRYEISRRVLKNISRVRCAHSWNIFWHEKRNFVSPSDHVMFYLSYKHQWNTKPYHFWKIREAISIHVRRPAMNRDQGYNLPPIYGTISSLIKTRLLLLTTSTHTREGVWMNSESSWTFKLCVGEKEYLFALFHFLLRKARLIM